jgi:hypothetical protein
MPAYRPLSSSITGAAADSAREAESLRQGGDLERAARLLEEALEATRAVNERLPGWLCGRLAAIYRTLGRYDDEVHLLERYRESQTSDDARTRYDARLSKARTIAERKRRSDSGALSSIRKTIGEPRTRRAPQSDPVEIAPWRPSERHVDMLADLLGAASECDFEERLDATLLEYCAEGQAHAADVSTLVDGLRSASRLAEDSPIGEETRAARFSVTLLRLVALYYGEAVPG